MFELSPVGRSRAAFVALLFALYLIASDRTVVRGDPEMLLFLFAPVLSVVAVGHTHARETFVRTALSVAAMLFAGAAANLSQGRGLPDYKSLSELGTALTGLFALNLMLMTATSAVLRRFWPDSNRWTQ